MKVSFQKIAIENFKSIPKLEFEFSETATKIYGANETGKTTIADAIFYVLTGKNSLGESTFDIVPVGKAGKSPSVTLFMNITDRDGDHDITLRRENKAKFNRDKEFTGDYATVCYINDVKTSVKDFDKWIEDKICNSDEFKLIFDTHYFTERAVTAKERKWEVQRRILFKLCEIPTDLEIAKSDEKYSLVAKAIENNYTANVALKAEKTKEKQLQAEINHLSDSIDSINSTMRSSDISVSDLEKALADKTKQRADCVDNLIGMANAETENSANPTQDRLNEIQVEIEKEADEKQERIEAYELQSEAIRKRLNELTEEKNSLTLEAERAVLRGREINKNIEHLSGEQQHMKCPTCHQDFPKELIASQMADLEKEKKSLGIKYKELKAKVGEVDKQIQVIEAERAKMQYPQNSERYNELIKERDELRSQLESQSKVVTDNSEQTSEIKAEIEKIENELLILQREVTLHKQLETEQLNLKLKLDSRAEVRQKIDILSEFIKSKCDTAEKKINNLFDNIKFELFEQNKTNDEIRDVCNIYYNGVPYEALSYSTKFIVGAEIALGFQRFLDVQFPVVVDNAESIDYGKEFDTQAIYLIKRESNCPQCGGQTGRRHGDMWTCNKCGQEFTKTIEIVSE